MKLLGKSVLVLWILFLAATASLAQGWCSFSCYRLHVCTVCTHCTLL